MNYKILNTIGDIYSTKAKKVLEQIGKVDYLNLTQDKLNKIIKNYDIIIIGLGLNFHKETLEKSNSLKVIATITTGLDHIDIKYAESIGIKVLSLRGENKFLNTITSTSELALGLMIDILRMTHSAIDSVKNYKWDRESFRGYNIYGLTLGIVGLGRLGSWMSNYGNVLGMKVLAYDPYIDNDKFNKFNCQSVNFNTLLKKSDVISIHVKLKKDTKNMFNKNIFDKMKNDAYLINTARGKIVNENDLLKALKNKKIAGYATDVLSDELNFNKKFNKHPLVEYSKKHDNLIIVPHIGGMTYKTRELTDIFMAKKVVKIFK